MPKVLIVEDDQALRDVFQLVVSTSGYEVEVAQDGSEAIDRLSAFNPDLILLDMLMPVKSGLEFMQETNIKESHPDTSVIILSNLSDSPTIQQALRLGAKKHLIKSDISPQDLLDELKSHFESVQLPA